MKIRIEFRIDRSLIIEAIKHLLSSGQKVSKGSVIGVCRQEFERCGTSFEVEPFQSYKQDYEIEVSDKDVEDHFKRIWK